jgi:uncharacterized protein YbcI
VAALPSGDRPGTATIEGPQERSVRESRVLAGGETRAGRERSAVGERSAVVECEQPVGERLAGGRLLAQISRSIVALLTEHYGRGPMKAKTYAIDDIVFVVMRGSGFTALEQTIMDDGGGDRVVVMRHEFQGVMASRFKETIEQLTGRTVLAFLSQAHVEPDITIEIFFVDRPLDGFGADARAEAAPVGQQKTGFCETAHGR